jgi:hypothetical protein
VTTTLLCLWNFLGVAVSQLPFENDESILPFPKIDDEPHDYHQTALTTAMELVSNVRILQETNSTKERGFANTRRSLCSV